MTAAITIGEETKAPKADIRILGVQIDTKLRWKPHIKKIQEKMATQNTCIHENNDINLGSNFCKSKTCLLCGITPSYYLWINNLALSTRDQRGKKRDSGKLAVIQNRCLRVAAGAYRATP